MKVGSLGHWIVAGLAALCLWMLIGAVRFAFFTNPGRNDSGESVLTGWFGLVILVPTMLLLIRVLLRTGRRSA